VHVVEWAHVRSLCTRWHTYHILCDHEMNHKLGISDITQTDISNMDHIIIGSGSYYFNDSDILMMIFPIKLYLNEILLIDEGKYRISISGL